MVLQAFLILILILIQAFLILREMIYDSIPVLLYMLLAAMTVSCAFFVGAEYQFTSGEGIELLPAQWPASAGLWAVLGDFSFNHVIKDVSSPTRNKFNWLPWLFYIEGFITMIFMVNLMSAPRI